VNAPPEFRATAHGFSCGAAHVTPVRAHAGQVIVRIDTGRNRIDIRVTDDGLIRTGDVRRIEASFRGGGE
jgi:hypothetical protein